MNARARSLPPLRLKCKESARAIRGLAERQPQRRLLRRCRETVPGSRSLARERPMMSVNDKSLYRNIQAFTVLGNRFGANGLRVHGAGAARSASSGQGCYPWDHSDGSRRVTRRPFASVLPVIARMANGHGFQQGNRAGSGSWPLHFWRRSARKISACRLRMRSIISRSICPAVGEYRSPHTIADE